MRATYSFGYTRGDLYVEWWHVIGEGVDHFVQITFDSDWFRREGSINDLKQMAIGAIKRKEDVA